MDFVPEKSPHMKTMPAEIFQEKWAGLKKILTAKSKKPMQAAA
jgi:hypothetical protein